MNEVFDPLVNPEEKEIQGNIGDENFDLGNNHTKDTSIGEGESKPKDLAKSEIIDQIRIFSRSNREASLQAIETDTIGALQVLENCISYMQSHGLTNRYLACNPQTPVRIKGVSAEFDNSGSLTKVICITNLTEISYQDRAGQIKTLQRRGDIVIIEGLGNLNGNKASDNPNLSKIKTKRFRHDGSFISFNKLRKKAYSIGVRLMSANIKTSHGVYLLLTTCHELISLDEFVEFSEVEEN